MGIKPDLTVVAGAKAPRPCPRKPLHSTPRSPRHDQRRPPGILWLRRAQALQGKDCVPGHGLALACMSVAAWCFAAPCSRGAMKRKKDVRSLRSFLWQTTLPWCGRSTLCFPLLGLFPPFGSCEGCPCVNTAAQVPESLPSVLWGCALRSGIAA